MAVALPCGDGANPAFLVGKPVFLVGGRRRQRRQCDGAGGTVLEVVGGIVDGVVASVHEDRPADAGHDGSSGSESKVGVLHTGNFSKDKDSTEDDGESREDNGNAQHGKCNSTVILARSAETELILTVTVLS